MTTGIYSLNFIGSTKVYIGQSLNVEQRFNQHLNLMRLGLASKKLQEAFKTFGPPCIQILTVCDKKDLNSNEKEAIEIFDSVLSGFNTCTSAGGTTQICGEAHPNSKYINKAIKAVLVLLTSDIGINTFEDISDITGVSKSVIAGVSSLQGHKWLAEDMPLEYEILTNSYKNGLRKAITKTGRKTDTYSLISPAGTIHLVSNVRDFAKIHGLDPGHVSKLSTRERKSHKGWKLCPANI